jgi:hypothetical protein
LLISAAFCEAQVSCSPPTSATIVPDTWYAGTINYVTVTTPNFDIYNIGAYCASVDLTTTSGAEVPVTLWENLDGGPGWASWGVEPAASVPTEAALLVVEYWCDPGDADTPCPPGTGANGIVWKVTFPVKIVNCPKPSITSVSPSIWFAGKSYGNVKITGTGFTTTEKATASCPATTVTIAAADGSAVPIGNVTVDSKTKITLSGVAPPASDPTQSATITAGTSPNTGTFNTAQILGNQIKCAASMPNCGGSVISTNDGSDPPVQNSVVGQQIALTTPALPSGITATSMTWTVDGTRIAGYTPTPASYATGRVTQVKDDDLKKSNITFYWVYPEDDNIPVTYKYCVDIPGVGNQCSEKAKAAFNLTGPGDAQMTVDAYNAVTINKIVDRQPCLPVDWDLYLQYGVFAGYDDKVCPDSDGETANPVGIKFTQPGVSSNGAYTFVQLLTGDKTTYASGISSGAFVATPGMDGALGYPIPPFPGEDHVSDSPSAVLGQSYSKAGRTFAATMYMLWTPSIQNSIPVPIGYQKWHFKTRTTNPSYPTGQTWATPVPEYVGKDGDVVPSATDPKSQSPPYGYPTWGNLATEVWFVTGANEVDQEEEQ